MWLPQAGAEKAELKKLRREEQKNLSGGKPRELTKKEKVEEARRQTLIGFRLVMNLLTTIGELLAKSPKHSNRGAGSMGTKATVNVNKIFNVFDMDMSKEIDLGEFAKVIRKDLKLSPMKICESDLTVVFSLIDKDESGAITLSEFASYARQAQKELKKENPLDEMAIQVRRASEARATAAL